MLALAGCLAVVACSHALLSDEHPLTGKVWDARSRTFVSPEQLFRRAAGAPHVILGEVHDNPEHHRLQLAVLQALASRGAIRLLAMEQFDSEFQAAIDAARARGASADALAEAGRLDYKGWDWPRYRPLVQLALERNWPIAAANLSRAEARAIVTDPVRSGLPPATAPLASALERDLVEGHCGKPPPAARLRGMVEAQRARDARMASVLEPPSVLIAGAGHARHDRGVPLYLPDVGLVSIAFMEVEEGKNTPQAYLHGFATEASFDYVWFTPPATRENPCP